MIEKKFGNSMLKAEILQKKKIEITRTIYSVKGQYNF